MDTSTILLRPGTPDDDEAIIAILNRSSPDMLPYSVAVMRHNDATAPAEHPRERHVAERNGQVVGCIMLGPRWWTSDPSAFALMLVVEVQARGQVIGTRLYARALERSQARQATRLYTPVRDDQPEAMKFAVNRGFQPSGHSVRMARLAVSEAQLAAFPDFEPPLAAANIRIASLAELGTDEQWLYGAYLVDNESSLDEPSSQSYQPPSFEQWRSNVFGEPGVSPDCFWLALADGRPVGMTFLELCGNGIAATGFTGVIRAYRQRGIASALKVKATQWAKEQGLQHIYTGNALTNAPMLTINTKLGFQPLPANIEMVKVL
jgi:mycothiol synthase